MVKLTVRQGGRVLRMAVITNLWKQGKITDNEAKDLLKGRTNPKDPDSFVDDSHLLGNPDALNIIKAEVEAFNEEKGHG